MDANTTTRAKQAISNLLLKYGGCKVKKIAWGIGFYPPGAYNDMAIGVHVITKLEAHRLVQEVRFELRHNV